MLRWLVAALIVACPPLGAASAQSPGSVSLDVARCETGQFDALAVIEAARVELAADGIPDVHAAASEDDGAIARIRIEPRCEDAATFVVHIDDLVTRKSVERTLTLDGVPGAAVPRALAIAAAELLRASWAELELIEAPEEQPGLIEALRVHVQGLREARALPVATVVPAPEPPPPPAPFPRIALGASGIVRAFPGGGIAPIGGRIALDVPLSVALRIAIDGEAVFGSAIHPLGAIDLGLASGGLALRYAAALDVVQVDLGVRVAGGGAWTQGHPTSAAAVSTGGGGFVLLVGGVLGVAIDFGDVVSARLDVEGGGVAVGFEAYVDRTPVAGLVGGYLAASIGLALRL